MRIQTPTGPLTVNVGDRYSDVFGGALTLRPNRYRIILKSHQDRIKKLATGFYKPSLILLNRQKLVRDFVRLDFLKFMSQIKIEYHSNKILYLPEPGNLELS
jgi:hypothetical protein